MTELCEDCKKPTVGGLVDLENKRIVRICYDCAVKRGYKEYDDYERIL